MRPVNIAALDLNLLTVLRELLRARSVSRAAENLQSSQPTVSRSLARLRAMFGDPLLVPAGRGLSLTARGEELLDPVERVLRDIEQLMVPSAFAPEAARLLFRVGMLDYVSLVVLPRWLARIRALAPGVDLEVPTGVREPALPALKGGALDLAIGLYGDLSGEFRRLRLFQDSFVCVARMDHPSLGEGMDLQTFVELDHAMITTRGVGAGPVDEALRLLGLRRRVALRLPHFLAAPMAVAQSDLVLTLPERVARIVAGFAPLRVMEPPIELEGFSIDAVWHQRSDGDPAHRWVRDQLSGLVL